MHTALTHYQDVVLRHGSLAPEIWGRVVYAIHLQPQERPCFLDFPGFCDKGMGFVARLYGTGEHLADVIQRIQPLAQHDLISIEDVTALPEIDDATEFGVTFRAKATHSARERRHQKRAVARALKAGDPLPEFSAPKPMPVSQCRYPRSYIKMMSASTQTLFPLLIRRKVVPSDQAIALMNTPRAGSSYGLGVPVPLIRHAER